MILSQLNHHLAQQKRVALSDLANHFGATPDALRGILDKLMLKGRVRKLPTNTACGGCNKCAPVNIEIYEWVER